MKNQAEFDAAEAAIAEYVGKSPYARKFRNTPEDHLRYLVEALVE
jgi:hypothetical protein